MDSKTEASEVVCTRCGLPATAKRPMSQYRATHRGLVECFEATREHASAVRVVTEEMVNAGGLVLHRLDPKTEGPYTVARAVITAALNALNPAKAHSEVRS